MKEMMSELNLSIENILNATEKDITDYERIKIDEYRLRILVLAVISGIKYSDKCTAFEIVEKFRECGLMPDRVFAYYLSIKQTFDTTIEKTVNKHKKIITNCELDEIYEAMLSFELSFNHRLHYSAHKINRDTLGSYYTPRTLADEVVEQTMDRYFEKKYGIARLSVRGLPKKEEEHILQSANLRILDPSCGCGEFLVSVKRYFEKYMNGSSIAIDFLWGFDVDYLALMITIVRLSSMDENIIKIIMPHMVLINPLLADFTPMSTIDDKIDSFAISDIYSKSMAADMTMHLNSYDIIVGNPPWEKVRFEERKFFEKTDESIYKMPQKRDRGVAIKKLAEVNPNLFRYHKKMAESYALLKTELKGNPLFIHSAVGELNTYALFSELSIALMKKEGVAGLILKGSIFTSPNNASLFRWFKERGCLSEIFIFSNNKKIFSIDSRERFAVAIFSENSCESIRVTFGLEIAEQMRTADASVVTYDQLRRINPVTGLFPNVSSQSELEFILNIHSRKKIFHDVYPECHYGRLVHLTRDSEFIKTAPCAGFIPIIEGKMIHPYDSYYGAFEDISEETLSTKKTATDKTKEVPHTCSNRWRYYINKEAWERISKNYKNEYSLYWRSLTSSTNRRTMIATIMRHQPTCQSLHLLQMDDFENLLLVLSIFNSAIFDYILRLKLSGIDLTQQIVKQMPVPSDDDLTRVISFCGTERTIREHIVSRAKSLAESVLGVKDTNMDSAERKRIIAEVDDLVLHAYNLRDEEMNCLGYCFNYL